MLAIVRIRIKNTIGSNQSLQTQNAFKHFLINISGEEDEGAHHDDEDDDGDDDDDDDNFQERRTKVRTPTMESSWRTARVLLRWEGHRG